MGAVEADMVHLCLTQLHFLHQLWQNCVSALFCVFYLNMGLFHSSFTGPHTSATQ